MRLAFLFVVSIGVAPSLLAQMATQAGDARKADADVPSIASILSGLPVRNIGPMTQGVGNRIDDIAVYEANTNIFYYASANGGVLKTTNGGKTSSIVFDKLGSASVGSIAVSQKNADVIWVGTGDRWQRNSVGMGDGVYKSTDGGKTWQDMGLKESISIGRIAIDPRDDNVVFVAALGSPWGRSAERGLYKTKDGGRTWKRVIFVDEKTAAVDVIIDPKNPNNMLASMWDHVHRPWGFFPTGPGSGIFRSTDGGETWQRVTKGLPTNPMGRIALDYFRPDPRNVVAAVEAAYPATGIYRSMDGGATWVEMPALHYDEEGKLRDKEEQEYWYRPHYNQLVRFSPNDVNTIYHGSTDHVSHDGGKTWTGFDGDGHQFWVDPNDPNHWMLAGDDEVFQGWGMPSSGWTNVMRVPAPSLFQTYGVGYDMRKLYWVMGNAQDAGNGYLVPTQGRYGTVSSSDVVAVNGSEAGRTMADPENWAVVYSTSIRNDLTSGKSMFNGPDEDWRRHTTPWFKKIFRRKPGTYDSVDTRQPPRESPSFEISPWNAKTLYLARNRLYKSTNRGETWTAISPDLTRNKPEWRVRDGSVYILSGDMTSDYPTINSISESPLKQGMIWVGTGDGYVQLTTDGGKTWANLTKNLPGLPDTSWVSRIHASRHSAGRAYVTFDNHRNVDLKPYVYVTDDSGKTWTNISANLPLREPVRVIEEGRKNPDLLYVGTEYGLWVSLDRGKHWTRFQDYDFGASSAHEQGYLPSVAVHDMHVHPRELDLVLGLHGRGFWILPARALEEMTAENMAKDVYFASPGNVYLFPTLQMPRRGELEGNPGRIMNTQPGTLFSYYLKRDAAKNEATIKITDASGTQVLAEGLKGTAKAGLNSMRFRTSLSDAINKPGDYRVTLSVDGKEYYQTLHVEDATDEVMRAPTPR